VCCSQSCSVVSCYQGSCSWSQKREGSALLWLLPQHRIHEHGSVKVRVRVRVRVRLG